MILKRYGSMLHSVTPNFDARAMNEIGFQRTHEMSVSDVDFGQKFEHTESHELTAEAEGMVQIDAETAVLGKLKAQLDALHERYPGNMLLVESEAGRDYPKLHEKTTTIVIEGENKLHFHRFVAPPLRIGVYQSRQS